MIVLGLIPLGCGLLLRLTCGGLSRRLAPGVAAPLLTLAALATSLATGVVLSLAGFAVFARDPLVAGLGGWRADRLRAWDQIPTDWGVLAAALAATLVVSALVYLARLSRGLWRAHRACRDLTLVDQMMISPDDHPVAFALPLPLRGGAIVVSTGMLALLPWDERGALLAHEAAHLRRHHAAYVVLAALAAAANPLLGPVARQVRLAVELSADDLAAREVGDPGVVARALARASLASATRPRPGGACLAIADSDIAARVRALQDRPPRLRPWAAAVVLAITLAVSAVAGSLTWAVHGQAEIAQRVSAQDQARARTGQPGAHILEPGPVTQVAATRTS